MLNLCQSCFKTAPRIYRRRFVTFHSSRIDPTVPLEEESLAWYSPDDFYPIAIGEVLSSSYKVLGKLGYGAHSTTWLCRHIRYVPWCLLVTIIYSCTEKKSNVRCRQSLYSGWSSICSRSSGIAILRACQFHQDKSSRPIVRSRSTGNVWNHRPCWPTSMPGSSTNAHDHSGSSIHEWLTSIEWAHPEVDPLEYSECTRVLARWG